MGCHILTLNTFICNGCAYSDQDLGTPFPGEPDNANIQALRRFLREWHSDSTFIETNTSGSTGAPTTIRLSKRALTESAERTLSMLQVPRGSIALITLSLDTIAGRMMVVRAVVGGLDIRFSSVSLTSGCSDWPEGEVGLAAMVPGQVQSMVQNGQWEALKRIHTLLIGGAPLASELESKLAAESVRAWVTYGMTETASHVALRQVTDSPERVYSAVPGVTFSVDAWALIVHAPHLSATTIHTRDAVELLTPTTFRFLGRLDHAINSGGIKILPDQLERTLEHVLKALPGSQKRISSVPDQTLGEKVVLVLEGATIKGDNKIDALKLLKAELSDEKTAPKDIVCVEKVPMTATGKVARNRLRELLRSGDLDSEDQNNSAS